MRMMNLRCHGAMFKWIVEDSEGAPSLELAPERRMSFCWFQPEGPQRLKLRLGPKEHLSFF